MSQAEPTQTRGVIQRRALGVGILFVALCLWAIWTYSGGDLTVFVAGVCAVVATFLVGRATEVYARNTGDHDDE